MLGFRALGQTLPWVPRRRSHPMFQLSVGECISVRDLSTRAFLQKMGRTVADPHIHSILRGVLGHICLAEPPLDLQLTRSVAWAPAFIALPLPDPSCIPPFLPFLFPLGPVGQSLGLPFHRSLCTVSTPPVDPSLVGGLYVTGWR